MNASFGFVIQRRGVFGAVVALVGLYWVPEKMELGLGCTTADPLELYIHGLELSLDNGIIGYAR